MDSRLLRDSPIIPFPPAGGPSRTARLAPQPEPTLDLRIARIEKSYGEGKALAGIDLDVRSGELLALLGPSGSGKTTLLRVVAGLEIPDSGRVFFGEEDATDLPVQQRGVGFVFQHYALFRHLTVFDNIAYGPRAQNRRDRPTKAGIAERVRELLALVQLDGLEKRYPSQLSGGQRQRVALARALAVSPRILLLDEPFGALDARVRRDLRRWLRQIHDETGQTTVFVTHDQDEALELADRVAILNAGRLEQIGTPDEIHDSPASAFVMSFVGESARLPAAIAGGALTFRGATLPVPTGGIPDGDAALYVRPWDVVLGPQGPIAGTVGLIRRVASGRRAEVVIEGSAIAIEADVPDGMPLARSDPVRLTIRGGRVFPRG